MRQFDLYENPVAASRAAVPFVVVLSSHLLPGLTEAIIAPVHRGRARPLVTVEVAITVEGEPLILSLSGLASVRQSNLHRKAGNLSAYEDDIRRALDRLFTGF